MSETFDGRWLALREDIDHRSRDGEIVERLGHWWAAGEHARLLDLGSGIGSNLRYLAPRLSGSQEWTLLDRDAELLAAAEATRADVTVETVVGDIRDHGLARVDGAHLVTASALLDLVSADWIEAVAEACMSAGAAAHFALSYDGTVRWAGEPDPMDERVLEAFNAHQRRDKGLGPALGPIAADFTGDAFRRRDFDVRTAASPWRIGPDDREVADALLVGWAAGAEEQLPEAADQIAAWAERRRATVESTELDVTVGHVDLLCLPIRPEGA